MSEQFVRVQFRALPQVNDQFNEWAAELGMSKSSFVALAAQIGAKALMRQVSPEKFITPELVESLRGAGYVMPEWDEKIVLREQDE